VDIRGRDSVSRIDALREQMFQDPPLLFVQGGGERPWREVCCDFGSNELIREETMTKNQLLFGASVLMAATGLPRTGRGQDAGMQAAQEIQMQIQQATQSAQIQQEQIQQQFWQQQIWQQQSMASQNNVQVSEHLRVGHQTFDASVAGLRAYLDTIKSSDPNIYRQFDADVARLESKKTVAEIALLGGVALGVAGFDYWLMGGETGRTPIAALGIGALLVGSMIALVNWPGRQDLLDVINRHNRVTAPPSVCSWATNRRSASRSVA
jgi:hypothetical protein